MLINAGRYELLKELKVAESSPDLCTSPGPSIPPFLTLLKNVIFTTTGEIIQWKDGNRYI